MASLNELVGLTFQSTNVSENGFIPDTSTLASNGTVTITPDNYFFSDEDLNEADTQTITALDTSTANSYRIGTATVVDTSGSGGQEPPITYDIIGVNGDQLLLGAEYNGDNTWGSYVILSNTNITEADGYQPTTMTFANTNSFGYDPKSATPAPETGVPSIVGRVFKSTNVSENGFIPDTSTLASNGTVTITGDNYFFSDDDLNEADTQTVTAVDTSTANSYRLGTMTVVDTSGSGGQEPPIVYDIIGTDGDQILLGAEYNGGDSWGSYVILSNTDISLSDGYQPTTLTFVNKDVYTGNGTSSTIPCFAAGTRIATPHGPVAVETLKHGDLVVTVSGEARAIVWAGHRRVDVARHPFPELVRPIRISAGAFAAAQPATDLTVSPDHNLFVGGVLIPAKCLVNGVNVVELDTAAVTYHHIELATHDVVLANNMPAETYLDTGNRANFAGGDATVAHPDFASAPDMNYFAWVAQGCAPLVLAGPELDAARATLAERAEPRAQAVLAA